MYRSRLLAEQELAAEDYGLLGKSSDQIPFMKDIRRGTLANGLQYFILENAKPENRAFLTLAVNAGSVLETDEELGFAHFVEHLAFNDTARFPKLELVNYLRSLGMRFGADVNAYTSYNQTVYGIEVPTEPQGGRKKIPVRALEIIDDWTHAISFKPDDVASESKVVLEEYRTRLGAMERVRKITLPILFKDSAYSGREPIGRKEIIETASAEQLRNFYNKWYRDDNMALILVGDFDGKALESELAAHFAMSLVQTPTNRPEYELPPPQRASFHVELITDPEITDTGFDIYFKRMPLSEKTTLAAYRESLVDYLIDSMLTQRFTEASTKPQTPFINAYGGEWTWAKKSRYYMMGTSAKTGRVEESLRALLLEKEAMQRYGFTDSELNQAKKELVSQMQQLFSEKDRQETRSLTQSITAHFIYEESLPGIEWELTAVQELLPGIGAADINAQIKSYFAEDDITVFVVANEEDKASLPSGERIQALFGEIAATSISPRESVELSADLLEKEPVQGSILAERSDETGAGIWQLGNGATVIFQETKNKNNEIVLYATARGGTTSAALEDNTSASLAAAMLEASGLGPYSRSDLIKKLAGKQVSLGLWNSHYYRGIQGAATAQDLESLFEMLYLKFTEPRIDGDVVTAVLDQYRTRLAQQEEDPQTYFSHEHSKTIYGNNPRYIPMTVGDLQDFAGDRALEFIKKCLNPADYTFVVVGNIDVPELRRLVQTYLASIPRSDQSFNTWADPNIVRPGKLERQVYKGQEEQSMVFLNWFVPGAFTETGSQTAALLTGYLDIVLNDEIREKMNGVYSIWAQAHIAAFPSGEKILQSGFACDPKNAKDLSAAVQKQLQIIVSDGLDQGIFDKTVEALLKSYETSLQRNSYIAESYANSSVLYETALNRLTNRPAVIQSIQPAAVRALCEELIRNGPVEVILYPESYKTNAP
ncbi:zinc protease [Spirochaetia bacterium]|nr:zinc protease [Spirochaetia bacterium]